MTKFIIVIIAMLPSRAGGLAKLRCGAMPYADTALMMMTRVNGGDYDYDDDDDGEGSIMSIIIMSIISITMSIISMIMHDNVNHINNNVNHINNNA